MFAKLHHLPPFIPKSNGNEWKEKRRKQKQKAKAEVEEEEEEQNISEMYQNEMHP